MISKTAYFICLIAMLCAAWFCPRWERSGGESSLGWDVSGYYWYLPSAFVYQDLKEQKFKDSILQKYQFSGTDFQQGYQLPNGNYVLKYSSGMALMYLPFFTMAHLLTPYTDYPADGFSKPYTMAISLGSLFIAFVGLWYFRKLLLRYYGDTTVAIVLLLLVTGTNYLNYTAIDGGLSHNWLFTLYVFILIATDNFYKTIKARYVIIIGLLCGLATLIRPTEIISLLIPLFWGMNTATLAAIKNRLVFFKTHLKFLLLASFLFVAIVSIQLFYWKYVSGNWIVYSYGDQGFSWKHPHLLNYTISYRSGWITYTPLVLFLFIGIIPFIKYGANKLAVLIFFALNLYIVSAWDIWWYAGTGGRAMVQSYPVLFFTLASFVQYTLKRKWALYLSIPFLLLFAYVNIWFTVQAHGGQGLYDSEMMNREYFWRVVGRWKVSEDVFKLKDNSDLFEGNPRMAKSVYADTLNICLNKEVQYSREYSFPFNETNRKWLRAEATFSIPVKEWAVWNMTMFTIKLKDNDGSTIREKAIRVHRFLYDGATKNISVDLKIPRDHFDTASITFWNGNSDKTICIKNLNVITFDE